MGVFLQAEDAAEDPPGGVIDRCVEDQARAAVLEPGVMATVHLDEEAGLGHALAAAAVTRGAALTGAADSGGAEESLHGAARDAQALPLDEHLGEMVVIHVGIAGAGQGEDPGLGRLREASGRGPAAVAMGESREAMLAQEGQQPTEVPQREAQELAGGSRLQGAMLDLDEQMRTLLFLHSQGNRLPVHAPRVTDSLTC